jgi:hypothetical protein
MPEDVSPVLRRGKSIFFDLLFFLCSLSLKLILSQGFFLAAATQRVRNCNLIPSAMVAES